MREVPSCAKIPSTVYSGASMTATHTDTLPHWDLSNVYPGLDSDAFQRDVDELVRLLDDLDRYLDEHHVSRAENGAAEHGAGTVDAAALGEVVAGVLDRSNALYTLAGVLNVYVRSFVTTDSYNAEAKRWLSRLEQLLVRLRRQSTRFDGWLGAHGDALPGILAGSPTAAAHA